MSTSKVYLVQPSLSVVIASFNSGPQVLDCLSCLRNQTLQDIQVVVVDSSEDDTASLVETNFPEVTLVRVPHRVYPGEARNLGMKSARGQKIAFLDSDCRVENRWAEQVAGALERYCVLGTGTVNKPTTNLMNEVVYLCEFSRWSPRMPEGWIGDLPAYSMAMRRELFERYGPFLKDVFSSDTAFCWKIGLKGVRIRFLPSIVVEHRCRDRFFSYLLKRLRRGRDLARVRVETFRPGRVRVLGYLFGSPLVAPLLMMRLAIRVHRWRICPLEFWQGLGVSAAAMVAWSLGEACGYLEQLLEGTGSINRSGSQKV